MWRPPGKGSAVERRARILLHEGCLQLSVIIALFALFVFTVAMAIGTVVARKVGRRRGSTAV